jgi:formylglycine-generating enzyme required for sulfatase activity
MKAIPGGKYMRGSTHTLSDNDEQPVKEITISNFFMDSTEVTQADFQALLNVQPWVNVAILGKGNNYPTWKINWFDAIYYCNARSKRDGIDTVYKFDSVSGIPGNGCIIYNVLTDFGKKGYRLPTESEWEYAARGGAVTEYYWGNYSKNDLITPKKYAWYDTNSAQPVAMKIPNNFGMYDMAGNVMEYANDYYHVNSYDSDEITDPKGVSSSEYKVLRGGYWYGAIGDVRPAERVGLKPKDAYNPHGFRVAHPYYK